MHESSGPRQHASLVPGACTKWAQAARKPGAWCTNQVRVGANAAAWVALLGPEPFVSKTFALRASLMRRRVLCGAAPQVELDVFK